VSGKFANDAVECIRFLIGADFASGFFEPLGLSFVLYLWFLFSPAFRWYGERLAESIDFA